MIILKIIFDDNSLSGRMQDVLGSPMYPDGQVQTGSWFSTLQKAFTAQGSSTAHGLRHFLLMQALCSGHSELSLHSGARTGTRSGVTETCGDNQLFITIIITYSSHTGLVGCQCILWDMSNWRHADETCR